MAAASHLLSVSTAASPLKGDIACPQRRLDFPHKLFRASLLRWLASSPGLPLPRRHCRALVSMLPTERHSCRSGRTAHGTAVSYSAWHTPIAGSGVVVLFLGGCWPLLTCPRTYLFPARSKQGPFPPACFLHAFPGTTNPSDSLPAPPISAFRPYMPGLCPTRLPGRASPVPLALSQRAAACDPGEVQHSLRSRMLSVAFAAT